jgi:hypothetical protein
MSIKTAGKEYKVLPAPAAPRSACSHNLQAFIEQLSSQLSSDVARLIKELKTQADEAIREAEKFDKIRSDFSATIQKIEVKRARLPSSAGCFAVQSACGILSCDANAQTSTTKAQGKKDAMVTYQHVNGVMEDFEANKVACALTSLPTTHIFPCTPHHPAHQGALR